MNINDDEKTSRSMVDCVDVVGGKASSLLFLSNNGFNVPTFLPLAVGDLQNSEQIGERISFFLLQYPEIETCAVRSSVSHEDGQRASFAGKYTTVLSVPANVEPILEAIGTIRDDVVSHSELIRSYSSSLNVPFDERLGVVVQEMIENPEFAGVVFSRGTENPNYMEVSYHEGIGEDLVSGRVNGKQLKVIRGMDVGDTIENEVPFLHLLVRDVQRIESLFGFPVDVEFAYKNGELYILQARPIKGLSGEAVGVGKAEEIVEQINETYHQVGMVLDDNFLGNMIDINPQELLGKYPLPLSFSLFAEMFPAKVIPAARAALGYECSDNNCLHLLGGRAFIDFKTAASNFRPAGIEEEDYRKIYAYYLAEIRKNPAKQNKVEFELFFSLDDQDTRKKLLEIFENDCQKVDQILACFNRTAAKIEEGVEEMMVSLRPGLDAYLELIDAEKDKMRGLLEQRTVSAKEMVELLVSILENIKNRGTYVFTQVARMDFFYNRKLAEFLGSNSLEDRTDFLLSGNSSIYLEFVAELLALGQFDRPDEKGVRQRALEVKFGHLRQSQFDLHEPNFAEQNICEKSLPDLENLQIKLEENQMKRLRYGLEMDSLKDQLSADVFEELRSLVEKTRFCDESRERVKFVFMKEYDLLRPLLLKISEYFQLESFADIFYLSHDDIKAFLHADPLPTDEIKGQIIRNRYRERIFQQIEMPDVIMKDYDVLAVQNRANEAVFVSNLPEVKGEIFYVQKASQLTDFDQLRDKILLLEDSDQGSSHLFNFGIKGVITKVGSAHSHMAVLLREYGLPAVLAVGEEMFQRLKVGRSVSINCREKTFNIL